MPMIAFTLSVFLLLITPGPGVLSTAGVGAAFGFRAGLRYVAGLCLGTNLVALIVVSGLAAVVLATAWARNTLLILSALYLLSIAVRIAFAGKRIAFIEAASIPGIRDALILQIINPKAYAVNMTWFSGFMLMPESLAVETAIKFLIINLFWIPIHLLWLAAGNSVNRLDLGPRAHFAINLGMALALVIVVGLAILSLL
ncbi:MAG TPA: LysE family transporter [Gammaproteobacteria bacterium]|nr:LysE family transporter [Gammaproteobacteria bacterium]